MVIVSTLLACNKEIPETPAEPDDPIEDNIVEEPEEPDEYLEILSTMSLEEKIGQLLIVGVEGLNFSEKEDYQLKTNKVGGFILFSRNIEEEGQFLKLLNQLKLGNNKDIPLFLAIDEEGGMVSRLSSLYGNLPDAKALGDLDLEDISYEYGTILGKRLKGLGLNLNFAPILDINSNSSNPVIGRRAFSHRADMVIKHGMEVIKGLEDENIIPTVKHFPGHGDTSVDSHVSLPLVNKSKADLLQMELKPFIKAIDEDIDMIMIAHILYPKLDPDNPSTMSGPIIKNLLRDELGYKNIIISDDMTMGAISENYSIGEASVKFLKNGGDILLICHGEDNPSLVIGAIKEALEKKELTMEDIDDKVYRILSLKGKYRLEDRMIGRPDRDKIIEESRDLSNRIINGG